MAERFAAIYPGAVTLEKFEGAGHTFITKEPESANAQAAIAAIRSFILSQSPRP
jgi:pimeloyl-ACP methyl ester carboxylesterase